MNTPGIIIAFLILFQISLPGVADPIRHRDVASDSPWSAHLDFERLGEVPLKGFLDRVAGFDRVLQLQTVFEKKLGVDWELVDGVTLFGAGGRAIETAMILRGDFGRVALTNLPVNSKLASYQGIQLRKGLDWQKKALILAKFSDKELVAGTSHQAVKDALDLLAGRKKSQSPEGPGREMLNELVSSAALFALDMKKINDELRFEADLTRAIERSWFLIGSRDHLVEATLMIQSTDGEGLVFLQKQLETLITLLKSRPHSPAVWLELAGAIEVKTRGNWMTVKVAASPGKSALFLRSLGPLFVKAPGPSGDGQ